jgi:uncharacterized membrane protein
LLGAGLVMAVLAAIAGLTDVLGDERIRRLNDVWLHAGGNVLGVLIELYNSILVTTIVQQRLSQWVWCCL